ncbi:MAG: hypothetical protein WCG97_00045 [bacterium]
MTHHEHNSEVAETAHAEAQVATQAPVASTHAEVEHEAHSSDTDSSMFMGILAYLGVLIIIPYVMARTNPFVKFHIKQGALLVIGEIILWVAMRLFWGLFTLISLLELVIFVLAVIGILNVIQKKEKELPLIGHYAKNIKI